MRSKINNEFDDLIMKFINKNSYRPWNWYGISKNPNITMNMIKENMDKPWNWYGISKNPNLTMDIIETNPHKEWIGMAFLKIQI